MSITQPATLALSRRLAAELLGTGAVGAVTFLYPRTTSVTPAAGPLPAADRQPARSL